jgi:uncharacterized cupredoxin-like copper-binding protein
MQAKLIAILIAMAIAFITVAISVRISPLRKLMFGSHGGSGSARTGKA